MSIAIWDVNSAATDKYKLAEIMSFDILLVI